MKDTVEDRLAALGGRPMPPGVEERIRRRLAAGGPYRRAPARRVHRIGSLHQWIVLAMLVIIAAWTVRLQVLPVLRAAWERAHCLVEPRKDR